MNRYYFLLFLLLSVYVAQAQVVTKEVDRNELELVEEDTILSDTILLPEIVISRNKLSLEDKKNFLILQNRVYKTYPYARLAAERLIGLRRGMAYLKTNKEKKKYFKIVEDYLSNEFEAKLKKLSRKQGQILVKLIHRQTGVSTYELVSDLKSGWKAFWANSTANLFDISLKTKYLPYEVNEDYLIETILVRAFESGRLPMQKPANQVNYDDLSEFWNNKASKSN